MAGLLGGVLPAIYSGADQLKRQIYGLLTNPQEIAQRAGQSLLQSHNERQALMSQAFGDPTNPTKVTNPQALSQLGSDVLAGELGFAPAGIVSMDVSKSLKTPLMTDLLNKEFQEVIKNTPNAKLTDEGLVINLIRKQKPIQSGEESVRSGVFYLPEGASQIKYYGGSGGYGGAEKIVGETLYKNPLFIKGATGGKAPENAYAQMTSKEEAKQLSLDALKPLIENNSYSEKVKGIENFLEKYAPSYKGNADYILESSKEGNQLRYALQELAIAEKARNQGYDSIIGYSKKKGNNSISEIFDLRESHYPTKEGDFQLNPKFESLLGK